MENKRKAYETPRLFCLGSVEELTSASQPPTNGSVICTDFSTEDALCENTDI